MSKTEALAIAAKHGVKLPDDVAVLFVKGDKLPTLGAIASWGERRVLEKGSSEILTFADFISRRYPNTAFGDKIIIRLHQNTLKNPSAVAGLLAHELHEIQGIRKLFKEAGGTLTEGQLYDALWTSGKPGIGGWLHKQAVQIEIEIARKIGIGIRIFGF